MMTKATRSVKGPVERNPTNSSQVDKSSLLSTKQYRDHFPLDKWLTWENFLLKNCPPLYTSRVLLITFLMAFTGLRINEARLMTWRDLRVLLSRGTVRIYNVKNLKREGRAIVLTPEHRRYAEKLLLRQPLYSESKPLDSYFLFHSSKDYSRPISSRPYVNTLINDLLRKFSLELDPEDPIRLTSHSYRSGFITFLETKGVPVDQIQRIIGHKRVDTTLRYSRFMTSDKQEQILSDVFASDKGFPRKIIFLGILFIMVLGGFLVGAYIYFINTSA